MRLSAFVTLALSLGCSYGSGEFVIVDRSGAQTRIGSAPAGVFAPRVSPDGRRVAFDHAGTISIASLTSISTAERLPAQDAYFPVWADEANGIFYVRASGDNEALFSTRAHSGASGTMPLVEQARAPESWSAANNGLSFIRLRDDDYDIWFYSAADRSVTPLVVKEGSAQLGSQFSPDGRWIAYESDETGRFEIFVEPFRASGAPLRITTDGGRRPMWSRDGGEMFFDRDGGLFAVTVHPGPPFRAETPVALPIGGFRQGDARRQYDLLPDGRFLVLVP